MVPYLFCYDYLDFILWNVKCNFNRFTAVNNISVGPIPALVIVFLINDDICFDFISFKAKYLGQAPNALHWVRVS